MRKKLTALFLCIVMAVSGILTGCGKSAETVSDNLEPESFVATKHVLVEHTKSDYKIVIPSVPSEVEELAAQELQHFLYESTNCELPIISDEKATEDGSYLSVGKTTLLAAQKDIVLDYDVMGESGTSIDTVGKNVYMAGATDYGTLFSVYRFLYYQIGFQAYTHDLIEYDYFDTLALLDFDYHYRPTVDSLSPNDGEVMYKGEETLIKNARMYSRVQMPGKGTYEFDGKWFGTWCHTIYNFLDPAVYEKEHPEWYGNGQLCYTNEELIAEFTKQMIDKYAGNCQTPAVMVGGADNRSSCQCSKCVEEAARYGGQGGVLVRFLNKISDNVEAYYKEKGIDHKFEIVGLFYEAYKDAPVIEQEDGSIVPVDESVILDNEGNVTVSACYAYIESCFTHSLFDETCPANAKVIKNLRGWDALKEGLYIYSYGANFKSFINHFNDWACKAGAFEGYQELKIKNLYEEATGVNDYSPMSSMRIYVRSRLAWNSSLKMEDLMKEFMEVYYGIGAEYVEEYFNAVMEQFEYIYSLSGECQDIFYPITKEEYWPLETYENFCNILQNGMNAVKQSRLSDEDKEIYVERIYREYTFMKMNIHNTYSEYLSAEELDEIATLVSEAREKYGINYYQEEIN